MSAFVISEVIILNEEAADQYRKLAASSIAKFGGEYLVRGADPVIIQGEKTDAKMVIVEFPSMERVQEWYSSPDYARALEYRDKALSRRLMFVEGINN